MPRRANRIVRERPLTPRELRIHLLPDLLPPHQLAGKTVIVVDILRATTTVAYALRAGVPRILPCLDVAEAREMARRFRKDGGDVLLGGERGGVPIAGFDLGNAPDEYTPDRLGQKPLIFTTTNGTRALMHCMGAQRVLLGSFANWRALWDVVRRDSQVEILCAGTEGEVSWEDTLFAGSIAAAWEEEVAESAISSSPPMGDSARLALAAWRNTVGDTAHRSRLADALRQGKGGRNLIAIGRSADIDRVAEANVIDIVPELDLSDWWIRPFPVH